MPTAAPHRCPRCKKLVRGKCPTCSPAWSRKPASWKRGGSTRRWRGVRAERLRIEPLCRFCGVAATIADHLDGTDYDDDSGHGRSWLNLDMTRSLCGRCHGTRTSEQGQQARR
jgi:5-methylcytosine-specific restriction protein A